MLSEFIDDAGEALSDAADSVVGAANDTWEFIEETANATYQFAEHALSEAYNFVEDVAEAMTDPIYYAYKLYMSYVHGGASNAYKIDPYLREALRHVYPGDLSLLEKVRIYHSGRAPGDGNSSTADAITDCARIYFNDWSIVNNIKKAADYTSSTPLLRLGKGSLKLLLHELTHAEQCSQEGGRRDYAHMWFGQMAWEFIEEILLRGDFGNITQDIHKAMSMEQDASDKAQQQIDSGIYESINDSSTITAFLQTKTLTGVNLCLSPAPDDAGFAAIAAWLFLQTQCQTNQTTTSYNINNIRQITANSATQWNPDISGSLIVWEDYRAIDGNSDIYVYDLTTNTEKQITTNSFDQKKPAISGNRIVWEDYRYGNADIYLYDLTTNTEKRITTSSANQSAPAISGSRIVWQDDRNGNLDIYVYDLTTNTEERITTDSANQSDPAISGNRIVWVDDRNGNLDIYVYDFYTNTERQITTNSSEQAAPAISGDRIVWVHLRPGILPAVTDIYLYDLSANTEKQITADLAYQSSPSISGDMVVWADARNGIRFSNWDVYGYDLAANTELEITRETPYKEGFPVIAGDKIVWADYRNGNWDIYFNAKGTKPALNSIGNKTVNEEQLLSFSISTTDPEGDTLTYSAKGLPTGAVFSGQTLSWTPDYNQAGSYGVTFLAADSNGLVESETITITVLNTNRAPVLDAIGNKTVDEGSTLTFTISATDPDGDSLTYNTVGLPTGATFSGGTRTFSWTPTYTQAGSYNVTFTVSDGSLGDKEMITICTCGLVDDFQDLLLQENVLGYHTDDDGTLKEDRDIKGIHKLSWENRTGYWYSVLNGFDASCYTHLTLNIKGERFGEDFQVGISDKTGKKSSFHISNYATLTDGFQQIHIPLNDYADRGVLLNQLQSISFRFDGDPAGTVYLDSIEFSQGVSTTIPDPPSEKMIDDFADSEEYYNLLDGYTDDDNTLDIAHDINGGHQITWSTTGGYWYSVLNGVDASPYGYLYFTFKGTIGNENFEIGLRDQSTQDKKYIEITNYLNITSEPQDVFIPLSAFTSQGLSIKQLQSLSFNFDKTPSGTIFINNLKFVKSGVTVVNDSDDDGMLDSYELTNGLNPYDYTDVLADLDGDGLTNREEFYLGTSANQVDSDGDGYSDYEEVNVYGTDPLIAKPLYTIPTAPYKSLYAWDVDIGYDNATNNYQKQHDLINFAKSKNINRLYFVVPYAIIHYFNDTYEVIYDITSWQQGYNIELDYSFESMRHLIELAHNAGIKVYALPMGRIQSDWGASFSQYNPNFNDPVITGFINAVLGYNKNSRGRRFDGIHFNIELHAITTDNGPIWNKAVNNLTDNNNYSLASAFLHVMQESSVLVKNQLPLSVSMSTWWHRGTDGGDMWEIDFNNKRQDLAFQIIDTVDEVTLLDYAGDNISNAVFFAQAELNYANNTFAGGKLIDVAFETNPLSEGAVSTNAILEGSLIPAMYTEYGDYPIFGGIAIHDFTGYQSLPQNKPPVLAAIGNQSVDEGTNLTFTVSATDNGDTLTYSASGLPSGAAFDGGTRTFNWTPAYSQSGSYNVTFTVSDGSLTDTETIAITVNNVNQAPVLAAIGNKIVDEGTNLTFMVSATDDDGDTLTYSASGLPPGAVFDGGTRTFNWTPAYSQSGIYPVTFAVSDGTISGTETITIMVVDAAICTGPVFANATSCMGDEVGLTADTLRTLVTSCTVETKCEYTCNSGYYKSGDSCVPNKPDLVMTVVSAPATAVTGTAITISNTVKNQGNAAAGAFNVRLYGSPDAAITTADTVISTRSISGLSAGASSSANTAVTIPTNFAAGTYYIGAIADYSNTVMESDEANNVSTAQAIVLTAGPDLVMTAVSGPASAARGASVTVSNTIKNQGAGKATNSSTVGLYLSKDSVITKADTRVGTRTISSLAAGATSAASTTVVIPTTLTVGTYYLGAIADYTNAVKENNETNNALAGNTIVVQ